jgi:hypothetical protein
MIRSPRPFKQTVSVLGPMNRPGVRQTRQLPDQFLWTIDLHTSESPLPSWFEARQELMNKICFD